MPFQVSKRCQRSGCGSTATHQGTFVSKHHHPLSSSSVGRSRSLPSSPRRGHHRSTVIICHGAAPRSCSTDHHGAAHYPLAATLEGRSHPWAAPREVRHHLPQATATERHPRPWAAATKHWVHHRLRSGALISGLVVTSTTRSRSTRSIMNTRLLFIWSDWILLVLFSL
jgi:hypothetical protein